MSLSDVVNRIFREFRRYTGDGFPGEPSSAPLPVGDPQSGVYSPKKAELRAAFLEVLQGVDDAAELISGFEFKGDWLADAEYLLGNVALREGSSWIAVQPSIGQAPPSLPATSNAYWQLIARRGVDGSGTVVSVVAGPGVTVDNTNPTAPVVSANSSVSPPQGRLSLSSSAAVPEADIVGVTNVYYLPCGGIYVPIYDGAAFIPRSIGAGLILALDSDPGHAGYQQASKCYDLWGVLDGATLRLATGPSWEAGAVAGSKVARGTGAGSTELELLSGLYVNKNAMMVRFGAASGNTVAVAARRATYLGTFYTAGAGLATDSRHKRWLDNAYNQSLRAFRYFEATFSWPYSTAAYRQANGSADSQVSWVSGLAGKLCDITAHAMSTTSAGAQSVSAAIGIDSATAPASDCNVVFARCASGDFNLMHSQWVGAAGLGFHEAKWLEYGGGADTQTWYGTTAGGGPPLVIRNGLLGSALL